MLALSILPRQKDDEVTGDLRLRIYSSTLSHLCREQLDWTTREWVAREKWFPTPSGLIDLASKWERDDEATRVRRSARAVLKRHIDSRADAERLARQATAPPFNQAFVNSWTGPNRASLVSMGLRTGALIERDGRVFINPEV
jgi:hypothetical protein